MDWRRRERARPMILWLRSGSALSDISLTHSAQLKAWKTSEAYRLKKMLKDGKITAKMYQEKKDETVSLYDSRKKEAIKKMTMKHNK
eukprot:746740-Hanusia_phi.AAC.3